MLLVLFSCGLAITFSLADVHVSSDLSFIPQAESWIQEKLQVANDGSYHDPTNLENKLQKHQECEAEVNANQQRIQNIAQVITIIHDM